MMHLPTTSPRIQRQHGAPDRSGNISVLAAVFLPITLWMVTFGVETGMICTVRTELQRTADAAALAAAMDLGGEDMYGSMESARSLATQYVENNPVLHSLPARFNPQTDVQFGKARINIETQRIEFTPGDETPNALRITVRYDLSFNFARVMGQTSTTISATAVAAGRPRDYMTVIDVSGSMASDTDEDEVAADLIALGIVPPGYFNDDDNPDPKQVAYSLTYDGSDPDFSDAYLVGEKYLPPSIRIQPLKATKDAAAQSIDVFEVVAPDELVGAVAYSDRIVWQVPLGNTFDVVKAKVRGATKDSGTDIHKGLKGARLELQSARSRPLADKVIVLMTDGKSSASEAIDEAQLAADARITIHCIGLGSEIDYLLLDTIASIARGRAIYVDSTSNPLVYAALLEQAFHAIVTDTVRVTLIE